MTYIYEKATKTKQVDAIKMLHPFKVTDKKRQQYDLTIFAK